MRKHDPCKHAVPDNGTHVIVFEICTDLSARVFDQAGLKSPALSFMVRYAHDKLQTLSLCSSFRVLPIDETLIYDIPPAREIVKRISREVELVLTRARR